MVHVLALAALQLMPHYEVLDRIKIGGEGGWDDLTVDSQDHRLYVTRGSHVMVLDTLSKQVVGDIPKTLGVHGVAISHKNGKGYISCGRENAVAVFDLKTLKETSRIKVGDNPDAIYFDAKTNQVITFNGRSNDASIIDAKTEKVVATLPLGGKPEFPQGDGMGNVFVNIEDKSSVTEIDAKARKVARSWSLAPGDEPTGLAYDPKGKRLFSVCGNETGVVSSTVEGKMLGSAKIGKGTDGAGYDPESDLFFSSNGADGTLTLVRATKDKMETSEVVTQKSARTMTLDRKSHKIYLIAAEFDAPAAGERRGKMKPGSAVILVVGPKKP